MAVSPEVGRTPVAIVGAGPVGLAAALILGRHGVRTVVCDQHEGINPHPRAHVVNTRSMELLRNWGLADSIFEDSIDMESGLSFVWKHTVAGEEFGRIDMVDAPAAHVARRTGASPVTIASCPQDRLQARLLEAVIAQGMSDVRYRTKVVSLISADDTVELDVEDPDGPRRICASYVIDAEGAAGGLRASLGIDVEGVPEFGAQINVYFRADLSPWTGADSALLYWVLNTGCPGVFIRMGGDRWTFNIGYDPTAESVSDYTPHRCADLVRSAVGAPDLDLDVCSVGTWVLGASTATRYRAGRVFLVGDAAHQFPPTGGLGMNTGLVDVDNLSWKLAAVLAGWAAPELLDTYESERRPVAVANARSSITNAVKMAEVGIGPSTMEIAARLESPDPIVAAAERTRMAAAVPLQRDHFDYLELEIGYVYGSDGARHGADPITTAVQGARLPHQWVEAGSRRLSLLDLVGPSYLVIAGRNGQEWLGALAALNARVPRVGYRVGVDLLVEERDLPWLPSRGVVVVRPDGHIAWIGDLASGGSPAALVDAIESDLGPTLSEV